MKIRRLKEITHFTKLFILSFHCIHQICWNFTWSFISALRWLPIWTSDGLLTLLRHFATRSVWHKLPGLPSSTTVGWISVIISLSVSCISYECCRRQHLLIFLVMCQYSIRISLNVLFGGGTPPYRPFIALLKLASFPFF